MTPKATYICVFVPWRKKEVSGGKLDAQGNVRRKYDHFNGLPISENIYLRMNKYERGRYNDRWYELIGQKLVSNQWSRNQGPMVPPVRLRITLEICGNMPDAGNPTDKPIQDALVQAGVLEDDSQEYVRDRTIFRFKRVEHLSDQGTCIECYNRLPDDLEEEDRIEYVPVYEI